MFVSFFTVPITKYTGTWAQLKQVHKIFLSIVMSHSINSIGVSAVNLSISKAYCYCFDILYAFIYRVVVFLLLRSTFFFFFEWFITIVNYFCVFAIIMSSPQQTPGKDCLLFCRPKFSRSFFFLLIPSIGIQWQITMKRKFLIFIRCSVFDAVQTHFLGSLLRFKFVAMVYGVLSHQIRSLEWWLKMMSNQRNETETEMVRERERATVCERKWQNNYWTPIRTP